MIYQFIENLSRLIMEWAIRRQHKTRPIVDEVAEEFSFHALRTKAFKKALS